MQVTSVRLARAVAALVADLKKQAGERRADFQFIAADDPSSAHLDFDEADLVRAVGAALAAAGGATP